MCYPIDILLKVACYVLDRKLYTVGHRKRLGIELMNTNFLVYRVTPTQVESHVDSDQQTGEPVKHCWRLLNCLIVSR